MSTSEKIFDNRPIGIFDSGLGGLTVASAFKKYLQNESIVYLGDNARVPYGSKSSETILRYSEENSDFLLDKGCKMIVAACNSASAIAVDKLKKSLDIPILGVLEAGADISMNSSPRQITVIGTRATINSDEYRRKIHSINSSVIVKSIACPLFVPLIEENAFSAKFADDIIDYYLSGLLEDIPDILLLGCTHYPLIKNKLANYLPSSVKIIDSASAVAEYTGRMLKKLNLRASPEQKGEISFYLTDMPLGFMSTVSRFFGEKLEDIHKADLI